MKRKVTKKIGSCDDRIQEIQVHPAFARFLVGGRFAANRVLPKTQFDLSRTDQLYNDAIMAIIMGRSQVSGNSLSSEQMAQILEMLFHGLTQVCRPEMMVFPTIKDWMGAPHSSSKFIPESTVLCWPKGVTMDTHYFGEIFAGSSNRSDGYYEMSIILTEMGPVEVLCKYQKRKKPSSRRMQTDQESAHQCKFCLPERDTSAAYALISRNQVCFWQVIERLERLISNIATKADHMKSAVEEASSRLKHIRQSIRTG